MHSPLLSRSVLRLVSVLSCVATASAFQAEAPPSFEVAYEIDTGDVRNESSAWDVVATFEVSVPGASWVQLAFDEIELSGEVFDGTGTFLRTTSHADGLFQELNRAHCGEWRNRTAYFNGDTVQVDLVAAPGTGTSRVRLARVVAGLPRPDVDSQCGPTDDREPSADPRAARLLPVGCTGWLIDDCAHCMLSAGHCASGGSLVTVQFNVPPSNPDGSLVHPGPDHQYAVDVTSMQLVNGGIGNDWSYYGAFANPGTGLTPFEAQGSAYHIEPPPPFDPSATIRITGFGVDGGVRNQVQQTHVGPWFDLTGTQLEYQTDTQGGNSGSPVLHEESGVAIGIHTHGGCGTDSGNSGTSLALAAFQSALADPRGVCRGGMSLLDEIPTAIAAGVETDLDVRIIGGVASAPSLHVRYDGGAFLQLPLAAGAGDVYRATLPPPVCGATPEFYITADTLSCGAQALPPGAPADTYRADVGVDVVALEDDIESASGWTGGLPGDGATTGIWTRVDPVGTAAQPEDDHTPAPGVFCWVTGQGSPGGGIGDNDVDGGITTLLSPRLDASAVPGARLAYYRWYSNDEGSVADDTMVVEVSDDDGVSWTTVETLGPGDAESSGGWFQHSFRVADLVAPTSLVRLRFVVGDLGSGSIVEAAVDDLTLFETVCDDVLADCNGNGIVDADDIASGRSSDADGDGIPDECPAVGTVYCLCDTDAPCGNFDSTAGCANSTGSGALLVGAGSASVAADDLRLVATSVPANQSGIVFMGGAQVRVPFGDGLRCASAGATGIFRFPVRNSGPTGTLVEGPGIVAWSLGHFGPAGQIAAGQTWQMQAWYRDPVGGPCGNAHNLSNGLSVTFVP